jgi:hypothetical protein
MVEDQYRTVHPLQQTERHQIPIMHSKTDLTPAADAKPWSVYTEMSLS